MGVKRTTLLASTLLAGALSLGSMTPALATALPSTGTCPGVGYANLGCDLVINLPASGSATVSNGPSSGLAGGTYDNSDDTLIGVTNNSGATVNSISLTSNFDIFGFDSDGPGGGPINSVSGLPNAWNGYGLTTPAAESNSSHGPGYSGTDSTTADFALSGTLNSFSNITANQKSGDVNFPGGLAPGATAWFGLEEPLTAASFSGITPNVPEPGSLALLGTALLGFGLLRRRMKA